MKNLFLIIMAACTLPILATANVNNIVTTQRGQVLQVPDSKLSNVIVSGCIAEMNKNGETTPAPVPYKNNMQQQTANGQASLIPVTLKAEGQLLEVVCSYYLMDRNNYTYGSFNSESITIMVPESGSDVLISAPVENALYMLVYHIDPTVSTEVRCNLADATNYIGFRPKDTNGELLTWPVCENTSDGGVSYIREGNIVNGGAMTIIHNKTQRISTYLLYSYPYIPSTFANTDIYFGDIYTNLTESDSDYVFTNSTILEKNDGNIYTTGICTTPLSGNNTISNDYTNYACYNPVIEPSPAYDSYDRENNNMISVGNYYNGGFLVGFGEIDTDFAKVWSSGNNAKDTDYHWGINYELYETDSHHTSTPYYIRENDENIIGYNPMEPLFGKCINSESFLNYTPSQLRQNYGSGPAYTGIYNLMLYMPEYNMAASEYTYSSGGLLGDKRHADVLSAKVSATYNGETIVEECKATELNKKMESWYGQQNPAGILDFTYKNSNYTLDNIGGETTTILHIDMTREDLTAPTLSGIQVRDANGNVGYSFESPENARLYLSTIDLNYNESTGNFDNFTAPESAKVEYSLHGNNQWTELPTTQIGYELDECCGFIFETDLSTISISENNTLYDLRITLGDASGNTMTETITPCLKFSSTGAVDATKASLQKEVREIIYFDLTGRRVVNPTDGIYIQSIKYVDNDVENRKVVIKNR